MPNTTRQLQSLRAGDPEQIEGYTVLRRIPGNHLSEVFLVRGARPGLFVLKLAGTREASDPERLNREATYLGRVRSNRVAKVVDSGIWQGRAFFVQEFVDGPTLADVLRDGRGKPCSAAESYRLARGLAEALRDVHKADVRHRDVKPANIIVSETRGVTLVDFGIALAEADPRITLLGMTLGTPRYMSPEQVNGTAIGAASDVFQWGLVVGEALLGRHPIPDIDSGLTAILRCDVDPALAGSLGELVRDALQRDPNQRPSLGQILAELDRTEVLPAPNETVSILLPGPRLQEVRTWRELKDIAEPRLDAAIAALADRLAVFVGALAAAALAGWLIGFIVGVVVSTPGGGS